MLATLKGTVKNINDQAITIEVAGIGFSCAVPVAANFALDKEVSLHTYLHWNQEQGPSLYGFATEAEKQVFLLVIACSGIGPKIGLAVLADIGPSAFLQAVQSGDHGALSTVSGIGAKKAEQMIVQLRHKVDKVLSSGVNLEGGAQLADWKQLTDVLVSLNYSRPEINNALHYVRENHGQKKCSFDQLMRHALSFLSKRR